MSQSESEIDDDSQEILEILLNIIKCDRHNVFKRQLMEILQSRKELSAEFSVTIDSKVLLDENEIVGHTMLREPMKSLRLFSKALHQEQLRLSQLDEHAALHLVPKPRIHGRVKCLPIFHQKLTISSIRSHDVGSFVQFGGTVIRTGQLKVLEAHRVFLCGNSKCNKPISIEFKLNLEASANTAQPTGRCRFNKKKE